MLRPADCRGIERQHLTGAGCMIAPSPMPEPRLAHLVQPLRQHVLEETAHELMTAEATPRFAMLVADGDAGVVERDDTAFGDGDAKHVAREMAQHCLGTTKLKPRSRGWPRPGFRRASAAWLQGSS